MAQSINWKDLTTEQKDRLIAEKIMGWEPQECDGSISWDHGIWRCLECGKDGTRHEETTHNTPTPHYTTSLDDAWMLIEHIIDQLSDATVKLAQWEEREMCFWCMRKDELCNEICIAALRAVGIEVQK